MSELTVYTLVAREAARQGVSVEALDHHTRAELEEAAKELIAVAFMTEGKVRAGGPSVEEQIAGELGVSKFEAKALMRKPSVLAQARQATTALTQMIASEAATAFSESLASLKKLGDYAESETVQLGAHSDRAKYSLELLKLTMAQQAREPDSGNSGPVVVNVNTQHNHGLGPLQDLPPDGIHGE